LIPNYSNDWILAILSPNQNEMLKIFFKVLIVFILFFSLNVSAFAQDYRLQIAAFPEQVPFTRFLFSGV